MGKRPRGRKGTLKDNLPVSNVSANINTSDTNIVHIITLAILGVIPLIVHLKVLPRISPRIDPLLYFPTGDGSDFFSYYKLVFLLLFTVALLGIFLYDIFRKDVRRQINPVNFYLIAFLLSLSLSLLCSPYKSIALWGAENRHMGFIAYTCLLFIMMVILFAGYREKVYHKLFYVLYPLTAINALLMACSFFRIDVLGNGFVRMLIMGKYAGTELESGSGVVGTLSHPNYISGLGAVLFALFCGKALFASKSGTEKMINFGMAALAGLIIFCSASLSGVVTLIFTLIFLAAVVLKRRFQPEIVGFTGLLGILLAEFFLLNLYDSFLLEDTINNMAVIGIMSGLAILVSCIFLLLGPEVKPVYRKIFTGVVLAVILGGSFGIASSDSIRTGIDREFAKIDSQVITQNLAADEFNLPAKDVALGSGRFYIWKSTLTMISEKPFFGYGLDTFAYTFKQGDPAKLSSLENHEVLIDKPHNAYLSVLYGAGGFAFLAYLLTIISVLIQGTRMIAHQKADYLLQYPLLLGIMAYAFQGLFNDPVIGIEIIGWIIMGYSVLLSGKKLCNGCVQ